MNNILIVLCLLPLYVSAYIIRSNPPGMAFADIDPPDMLVRHPVTGMLYDPSDNDHMMMMTGRRGMMSTNVMMPTRNNMMSTNMMMPTRMMMPPRIMMMTRPAMQSFVPAGTIMI